MRPQGARATKACRAATSSTVPGDSGSPVLLKGDLPVARGWLLVSDTSGALGAAWRTLAARADSPVSFGMPEQVGEKGEAVMFRCRAASVSSPQPLATGR